MKIIRPVAITSGNLASSSIPEPDASVGEAAWNSGTAYALNDEVILASTHRRYRSANGVGNTNKDPATQPTYWTDIGPTNRWAMFDQVVGTASTDTTTLQVQIEPGIIDTIALLDVDASTVQVTMVDGVTTVYDETLDMESAETIVDWYGYFFDPIIRRTTAIFTGLPPYSAGVITVTLTETASTSIGTCIAGRSFHIGGTQYGAQVGIQDYSRKEADEFGAIAVVERSYAKKLNASIVCEAGATDEIFRTLAEYRARPVIWIGSERYDCMVLYGFYRDMQIAFPHENHNFCTLQILGLT